MVIQGNMSPKAIIEVWDSTKEVFDEYDVSLTDKSLQEIIDGDALAALLNDLNKKVGSSSATCIEGG
ncbi:hypothetical protein [Bacillus sp. V59.32b]|uniref:hypothetical protein n=1 Tax=Bacillus sp. V59.32b TaxID=1758642 RepID=UPI000E3EA422|nr:hypothetical protein [Bacillus sp. V59.32b]RFU60149.1 hypothetical protein D0463_18435 [Bacillus sp. V59.32b]